MKTQISKPVREKSQYSTEYKEEALALWRNSGRSAAKVAAQLGIRPPLLYRWARLARVSGGQVPTGKSPGNAKELEEENRRLRQENAKLREQREVLKKSLGILCEAPHRDMPGSNK
jgi:transposase